MSAFSQECCSNNGKFHFKLEWSKEDKPLKLLIEVISPKNESVTVLDLADAVYENCFEISSTSFKLDDNTNKLPCEVRHGTECRDIEISWFDSYDEILGDIASQISI